MNSIQALAYIMTNPEGKITSPSSFDRQSYFRYDNEREEIVDEDGDSRGLNFFVENESFDEEVASGDWEVFYPPKLYTLAQAAKKIKENKNIIFSTRRDDGRSVELSSMGENVFFDDSEVPFDALFDKVWYIRNEYEIDGKAVKQESPF